MTYETIITIICVLLASTILLISYRFDHWRKRAECAEQQFNNLFERFQIIWLTNEHKEQRVDLANARADRAEAALARVEAEIAKTDTKPVEPTGQSKDYAVALLAKLRARTGVKP
jgi:hypothetical protein